MCVLYVSFGSKVRPRTFRCVSLSAISMMFEKIMLAVCICCCCCSPSETYGRKWGDSNFQILTELPVPPQAAGVVGTFNVLDIYPSEHYGLSFLDLTDAFFLQCLLFFVYISILQVHFACVLCI